MAPRNDDFSPYMKPVNNRTKCENILRVLWNEEDKTVLGRTAKGWGLIIIFYCIFYIVLAAMFSTCMWVMLNTLPENQPMYTLHESLIGTNPGMGFRPQFVDEGSLIMYNVGNKTQVSKYVDKLNEFLGVYTDASNQDAAHRVACNFTQGPEVETQACRVNVNNFGPCTADKQYGYKDAKPCIFLKLNKIYGWVPEYYTNSKEANMPDDLQKYIDSVNPAERNQVWISCDGEDPGDREGLQRDPNVATDQSVRYYPSRGIPQYYYPYKKQLGYISPIIAVQFTNMDIGRIVNIRCRAWAKNIIYSASLRDLSGSTHIEIMIDKDENTTAK